MPWFVNKQLVPEQLIRQESDRIGRDPQWQSIPNGDERGRQLRAAAERSAIDRVLIEQAALRDPRPVDPESLAREIEKVQASWGPGGYEDEGMRAFVDRRLRVQRANQELVDSAAPATEEQIEAFYTANRQHFPKPEMFRAAHIVKYINRGQTAQKARAGIETALAALNHGEPFAEVANHYSDCSDIDGDLGQFPAGYMVEEFETVLRALAPGERSGIFPTPFGLHIAELREKLPAGLASLEDVRGEIARVLTFARQHEVYTQAVAKLRAEADIRFVAATHSASQS